MSTPPPDPEQSAPTPRTDANEHLVKGPNAFSPYEHPVVDSGFARQLERELNAAKQPVPDAGVRSDIADKIECLCGYLTAIMKGKYRFSYEEIPAVVQEASEFAEQLRGENRFPESPLTEKTGQLLIKAPTPATSEDTLMLDWLEKHRHVMLSHWENGCMVELFHEQYWNDRHNQRDDRFCKTYRELLRYQLAEESKYAMAHAGEQKT